MSNESPETHELQEPVERLVIPCRGVAVIKMPRIINSDSHSPRESFKAPALPISEEVKALVSFFKNGAQKVCCTLAHQVGNRVTCKAVDYQKSPYYGANTTGGTKIDDWEKTGEQAYCTLAKDAPAEK